MKKGLKYTLIGIVAFPIALVVVGIIVAIYGAIVNMPERIAKEQREKTITDSISKVEKTKADSIEKIESEKRYNTYLAEEKLREEAFKKLPKAEQRRILQEREEAAKISQMKVDAENYIKSNLQHFRDFSIISTSEPNLVNHEYLVTVEYSYIGTWRAPKEMQKTDVVVFNETGSKVIEKRSYK